MVHEGVAFEMYAFQIDVHERDVRRINECKINETRGCKRAPKKLHK